MVCDGLIPCSTDFGPFRLEAKIEAVRSELKADIAALMEPGRRPEGLRWCDEADLRPSPGHCRELLRLRLDEVLEMVHV